MTDLAVGKIIHKRRTELDLSLEDLAMKMGVSKATVARWENGDIAKIKSSHLYRLSEILHLPIGTLLGDEGLPEEDASLIIAKNSVIKKIESITDIDKVKQIDDFTAFIIKK